jgi:apolipoprotein N-acyltransferase
MLICLEEAISKAAKQSLAQGAEIFISPSNHGDTGKDCALQQERMGQLRAVETCTPLVRVGNIGASNIFDFAGREIFRNEGEKMSNVQVPILKDRSKIFPNIYLKTQEAMLWIFISIFAIGLFSNLAHKKVDIAPEKN